MLDGESLKGVDKFKYLGSIVIANGQGTEDFRKFILFDVHNSNIHGYFCYPSRAFYGKLYFRTEKLKKRN